MVAGLPPDGSTPHKLDRGPVGTTTLTGRPGPVGTTTVTGRPGPVGTTTLTGRPGPVGRIYWRSGERGIARREIVAAAALGLSALALAVPAVWVSKTRMSVQSRAVPLMRAAAVAPPRTGAGSASLPEGPTSDEVRLLRDELLRRDDQIRRLEEELALAVEFRERAAASVVDLGRFIEAFVVGQSVNWQERSFLVDRGREDGVVPRAGCLEGGAVVGVVVEVGPHVARVACLSEPGVRLAARSLETRRTGLLVGTAEGSELRYVSRWAPRPTGGAQAGAGPREGEFVVTSGRLGFFPPGFVIGWITSIGETPDSLHLNIAVRPEIGEPPTGRVWILRPTLRSVDE